MSKSIDPKVQIKKDIDAKNKKIKEDLMKKIQL